MAKAVGIDLDTANSAVAYGKTGERLVGPRSVYRLTDRKPRQRRLVPLSWHSVTRAGNGTFEGSCLWDRRGRPRCRPRRRPENSGAFS